MKLFVLLSRFPYPLEKGDKLRAFHQIKILSQHHEIHLCCLSDQTVHPSWKAEVGQYCQSIHVFTLSQPVIWWNTAKQIFGEKPFQVGYFYQRKIAKKIQKLIKEIKVDHIYCQLIRTAEYVKNIHDIPKTIDYQDALSKGMFRRAEISSGIRKQLFRMEGKRLSEYENRIFDYFNHHTIISEQDRSFINHPNNKDIHIIENGISNEFFDFPITKAPQYEMVFIGNMNYPPNVECAEYIVHQILPKLPEKVRLLLAGASPSNRIKALESKRVQVSGWIDDIRTAYADGKIFVAPLFIGTGLQNKLLEAMAMGLPVVTTPLANNALSAQADEHLLLADNENDFASAILTLLEDEEFYDRFASNGKAFVRANFSWENSVRKLEKVFKGSFYLQ